MHAGDSRVHNIAVLMMLFNSTLSFCDWRQMLLLCRHVLCGIHMRSCCMALCPCKRDHFCAFFRALDFAMPTVGKISAFTNGKLPMLHSMLTADRPIPTLSHMQSMLAEAV